MAAPVSGAGVRPGWPIEAARAGARPPVGRSCLLASVVAPCPCLAGGGEGGERVWRRAGEAGPGHAMQAALAADLGRRCRLAAATSPWCLGDRGAISPGPSHHACAPPPQPARRPQAPLPRPRTVAAWLCPCDSFAPHPLCLPLDARVVCSDVHPGRSPCLTRLLLRLCRAAWPQQHLLGWPTRRIYCACVS